MSDMKFYLDTSVFGGYYDREFESDTKKLFEKIRNGHFTVMISVLTKEELLLAPAPVMEVPTY